MNKLTSLSIEGLQKKKTFYSRISIFNLFMGLLLSVMVLVNKIFYVDRIDYWEIIKEPMFLIGISNLLFVYSNYRNSKKIEQEIALR